MQESKRSMSSELIKHFTEQDFNQVSVTVTKTVCFLLGVLAGQIEAGRDYKKIQKEFSKACVDIIFAVHTAEEISEQLTFH